MPLTRTVMRTRYWVTDHTLVVRLHRRSRVLSSAPQGGGLGLASYILNHQVGADDRPERRYPDPSRYLRDLGIRLGIDAGVVGLMTAVPMAQLVTARVTAQKLWVECFATVGVTNAVRAGEWPVSITPRKGRGWSGTINVIVITNASLSTSAMVGAVQVVTEAKTGSLHDHAVRSRGDGSLATGTGTDAVVIACATRGQGPSQPYSGTHTVIGALIGAAVAQCVSRGLVKAERWHRKRR